MDDHREHLPIGRSRLGRLALAALVGGLLAAAGSLGSAQAGAGCVPVSRLLSNGDPALTEGALQVTVDGLGAYGRGMVAGDDAVFNPPGSFAAALGTTYTSNLYLNLLGRMLADDCINGDVVVLSENPLRTRLTIGPPDSLQIDVTQELDPITLGGSTLRQTYTITNNGGTPRSAVLVRHLDGDLRFVDNSGAQDGAAASGAEGRNLTQFDSVSTAVPRGFVALTGSLGSDDTPDRWTVQQFDYRPLIEGAGGIPPGDHGVVFRDTDGDLDVDIPFDVTLSQQWGATIAPTASVTIVTSTRFDAENRAPSAVPDTASTNHGTPVNVDVRANDSDPDGDPLGVESVTQPQHGTATIQSNGLVRYVPAAGYAGGDSFSYTIGDGRGATAVSTVGITVDPRNALTVAKTGNGKVVSTPAGIDCGSTCTGQFVAGTSVTLVATPDPGWTFEGWSGPCSGRGACTIVMDAAKTVGADFLPPPPTGGSSANVEVTRGTVFVKVPGSNDFVELRGATQVPVGSQVDTTAGAVELTVARGATLDTSEFYDGLFTVLQPNARSLGELRLDGGDFLQCLSSFRVADVSAKRRPVRKLWGSGKGRFRTRGRYSSASVRGTKWLTVDLCEGTMTTVTEGIVVVRDISRGVNVTVRAGRSYLARPLPRSVRNAGCTLIGTKDRDFIRGTSGRDVICGLSGDDVLTGLGGNDRLIGGPGNDRLLAGAGEDVLLGNAGKDFLNGGPGNDVLQGGPGNDFMVSHDGERGNDRLSGGPGRDRCFTDFAKICP